MWQYTKRDGLEATFDGIFHFFVGYYHYTVIRLLRYGFYEFR